jgi:8-oxo-dGTP pyrophosphatase MutT (NUDIX family)
MFCYKCGHNIGDAKQCEICKTFHYKNPIPVGVALVQTQCDNDLGLVMIQRKGAKPGSYAMPGGFMEVKDGDWRISLTREVKEETGLDIGPATWTPFDMHTTGDKLLIFALSSKVFNKWDFTSDVPDNPETEYMVVCSQPHKLLFPLHELVLNKYLAKYNEKVTQKV